MTNVVPGLLHVSLNSEHLSFKLFVIILLNHNDWSQWHYVRMSTDVIIDTDKLTIIILAYHDIVSNEFVSQRQCVSPAPPVKRWAQDVVYHRQVSLKLILPLESKSISLNRD